MGQMTINIGRRELIVALGIAAAWPLAVSAQKSVMSRIGLVTAYKESDPAGQAMIAAFRQELQKLGWMEGRNIAIDIRYASDDPN
jgi:putative tryptophan/tyrosine transport system substrate-binding protein